MSLPDELRDLSTAAKQATEADLARRQQQRDENRLIGEGDSSQPPLAEVLSLEAMLARCVLIGKGGGVVLLPDGDVGRAWMFKLHEFVAYFSASQTELSDPAASGYQSDEEDDAKNAKRRQKRIATTKLWLSHPNRPSTYTITWSPGRGRFASDPKGVPAVNTWSRRRIVAPSDWEQRVGLFVEHLEYLVPVAEERERFLDWLAHIEQVPEVLPHHGYLMFTPTFGIGRNWLASVLTRVWRGNVAASLDLLALLDSQFNGRISEKVLAVVDEIHLGDSPRSMFTLSAKLRQMMTQDKRLVNHKYGMEVEEFGVCRWLLFSNHEDALPMPKEDRRFWVIANPTVPRSPGDYVRLYAALDDPCFISSVAQFLAARDVRHFNPGARPELNEAKRRVIEATTPELEKELRTVLDEWPSAVAAADDLLDAAGIGRDSRDHARLKHFGRAMPRLGCVRYAGNKRGRVNVDGQRVNVWVLRDHDLHNAMAAEAIAGLVAEYRRSVEFRALLPKHEKSGWF